MSRPGTILQNQILLAYGSLPDMRLWRNVVASAWIGEYVGQGRGGTVVLAHARKVEVGLCVGASDLIGISNGGLFTAIEVKAGKDRTRAAQGKFIEVVRSLHGIAGIARSVEEAGEILRGGR